MQHLYFEHYFSWKIGIMSCLDYLSNCLVPVRSHHWVSVHSFWYAYPLEVTTKLYSLLELLIDANYKAAN